MIRIALVLLLLVGLSGLHEPYRRATVPVHVTGEELSAPRPGLVTFNGTVLKALMTHEGGKTLTLQVDNQQVTAYIGPQLGIGLPQTGAYVSITGKMLGEKVVALQSKDDYRLLLPTGGIVYSSEIEPGVVNQRVEFRHDDIIKLPKVSDKGIRSIQFVSNGQVYHGFVQEMWIDAVMKSSTLKGYKLPSGAFMVEGWS